MRLVDMPVEPVSGQLLPIESSSRAPPEFARDPCVQRSGGPAKHLATSPDRAALSKQLLRSVASLYLLTRLSRTKWIKCLKIYDLCESRARFVAWGSQWFTMAGRLRRHPSKRPELNPECPRPYGVRAILSSPPRKV